MSKQDRRKYPEEYKQEAVKLFRKWQLKFRVNRTDLFESLPHSDDIARKKVFRGRRIICGHTQSNCCFLLYSRYGQV